MEVMAKKNNEKSVRVKDTILNGIKTCDTGKVAAEYLKVTPSRISKCVADGSLIRHRYSVTFV